jgi:hypothetical protein
MKRIPPAGSLPWACVVVVALMPATAAASDMYGSAFDTRQLFKLDQVNGAAMPVGSVAPMTDIRDMASDTRPDSYRLWATSQSTGELFRLNPATGAATRVGLYGLPAGEEIRALAFDTTRGGLYGITGATNSTVANLYSIDQSSGAATLVGSTGLTEVGGAAFDWFGQLFAVKENTGGLYRIDTATAVPTQVSTIPVPFISDIAFRPEDNTLFGITHGGPNETQRSTYRIDPATGAATRLGPYGLNITTMAGLAFGPGVPEPGTALAALGGATLLLGRSRRTRPR